MKQILNKEFYLQNTVTVAQNLLGKMLIREYKGKLLKGIICQTEAYLGEKDSACHTYKKKTKRNSVMFKQGGFSYVYFVYGMHYMFNIVSEDENIPCAVLIREIYPIILDVELKNTDNKEKLCNGPAKLCKVFHIDKSLNDVDLTIGKNIWLEKFLKIPENSIKKDKRIGINYALEKDQNALLRFSVSKKEIENLLKDYDANFL